MKHNSEIGKAFHKIQNLEKGNQQRNRKKPRRHFKTKCFLMVQEGWKKHKTGDAKGCMEQETHVFKKGKQEKKEKHKEN